MKVVERKLESCGESRSVQLRRCRLDEGEIEDF